MRVPKLRLFLLPLSKLLVVPAILLGALSASAITLTPPPGSPLLPDDGTDVYCPCDQDPNPIITRNVITLREGFDAYTSRTPHEWGIYFLHDPSVLIPVFTADDFPSATNASAAVNFDNGTVVDLDTLTVEYEFEPTDCCFGFYLKVGDDLLTYSQASLNPGGVDTFGSFPHSTQTNYRVLAFEVDGHVLSLEAANGLCPIPEPSMAILLGGGLALIATRRRQSA